MWNVPVACFLFTASLLAVTLAKETKKDAEELKELLGAVRSYLDRDDSKRADLSAYEDVRTIYDDSVSQLDVGQAEADGSGYWTDWINTDTDDPYVGAGEFESCSRIKYSQDGDGKCYLGCERPIAASYAHADPDLAATWLDIENCVGDMNERVTSCGVSCINSAANNADKSQCVKENCESYGIGSGCDRCPNVRVKFFCMGSKPEEDKCCEYSTHCEQRVALREQLKTLAGDAEKRDVISGILQVKDALEIDN